MVKKLSQISTDKYIDLIADMFVKPGFKKDFTDKLKSMKVVMRRNFSISRNEKFVGSNESFKFYVQEGGVAFEIFLDGQIKPIIGRITPTSFKFDASRYDKCPYFMYSIMEGSVESIIKSQLGITKNPQKTSFITREIKNERISKLMDFMYQNLEGYDDIYQKELQRVKDSVKTQNKEEIDKLKKKSKKESNNNRSQQKIEALKRHDEYIDDFGKN